MRITYIPHQSQHILAKKERLARNDIAIMSFYALIIQNETELSSGKQKIFALYVTEFCRLIKWHIFQ